MNPAGPNDLQRRIEAVERIQMLNSLDNLGLKNVEAMKMEQGVNLTHEGKIQSLERELDLQQSHEFLYTQVITELQVKLSESELRERRLRECLEQAKRSSDLRMENLAREKLKAGLMLLEKDEILKESERRSSEKLLELEKEVDSLKKSRQLLEKWYLDDLKTEQLKSASKEEKLKESLAEAQRSLEELRARLSDSEVEKKIASLIIEELRREKSEADEILKELRQRSLKAREAAEANIERFRNVLPIAENLFKLLNRNVEDLVGMKHMLLGEEDETNTHRMAADDCGEVIVSSRRGQKRKRSESSPLLGADMVRAFQENDELCVEAACTLYKQHLLDSESSEGSKRRFYHFERLWRDGLANVLIQGDPGLRVTRPVAEVKQRFPHVVNLCRQVAIEYSSYFIAMPGTDETAAAFSLCLVRRCCYKLTVTDTHPAGECENTSLLDDVIEIPDH